MVKAPAIRKKPTKSAPKKVSRAKAPARQAVAKSVSRTTTTAKRKPAPRKRTQSKQASPSRWEQWFTWSPVQIRLGAIFAAMLMVLGAIVGGWSWINKPESMPITQIDIRSDKPLKYIEEQMLRNDIQVFTKTNLYLLDERALELMLEGMPWIRAASLRKVWPQQLEVRIEEQVPIAFWGEERMLNQFGEIFDARLDEMDGVFPTLYSPVDKGRELAERYVYLNKLLSNLSLEIAELTEDETGAWRIVFRRGPEVMIGRKEYEKRLSRFKVGYVQQLHDKMPQIRRIDLRYTNGFAVEWKQAPVGS